jgi:YHS domain-containing protein
MWRKVLPFFFAVTALASYVGCNNAPPDAPPNPRPEVKEKSSDAEHAHKPGAHGGSIVEIGRDNYHAEAVFEKGGVVRLYLLGRDEAKVQEVEAQTLTAYVKVEGDTESTSFSLEPVPQAGDAAGQTSQFLGRLPKELSGRRLEVTVPSIRIAGERFRFGFQSVNEVHEAAPPAPLPAGEERALYLTPGGKYTAEDIQANGVMTAAEKFKGQMAAHNLKTQSGDKICPITLTKANPKFSWVVGGKTYEFCCPPCVDEFVKVAKEQPETIQEPEAYIKRK